jgi:hypothetical protein
MYVTAFEREREREKCFVSQKDIFRENLTLFLSLTVEKYLGC